MHGLEHDNVMKLHGYIIDDKCLSLILDWAQNLTVIDYIKGEVGCRHDRVTLVGTVKFITFPSRPFLHCNSARV